MAELKCLVFKNDDLEFLKKQYPGIYGLLGSKLADYDKYGAAVRKMNIKNYGIDSHTKLQMQLIHREK